MKRLSLPFALALVCLGLAGCANDAEEKCNEVVSNLCDKFASCGQNTKEACSASFKKNLDCSKAADVPSDYEECPAAIKALTCPVKNSLPSSCDISFRK